MANRKEYLCSVNEFNEPAKLEGKNAISILLMRLILLNPGSDPLHPRMGVGISNYRYALNRTEELQAVIEEQIRMFLPDYQDAQVEVVEITSEKICNIEITIGDTTYVYDSKNAPVAITLAEIGSR